MRIFNRIGISAGNAVRLSRSDRQKLSLQCVRRNHNGPHLKKLTQARELIDQTDAFIFDCDGVIWKGDTVIPHANAMLKYLGYMAKFKRLGLDVFEDEVSSFATALYFQRNPLPSTHPKVYVIGME
eukprot:gene18361-21420_t